MEFEEERKAIKLLIGRLKAVLSLLPVLEAQRFLRPKDVKLLCCVNREELQHELEQAQLRLLEISSLEKCNSRSSRLM